MGSGRGFRPQRAAPVSAAGQAALLIYRTLFPRVGSPRKRPKSDTDTCPLLQVSPGDKGFMGTQCPSVAPRGWLDRLGIRLSPPRWTADPELCLSFPDSPALFPGSRSGLLLPLVPTPAPPREHVRVPFSSLRPLSTWHDRVKFEDTPGSEVHLPLTRPRNPVSPPTFPKLIFRGCELCGG